MDPPELDRLALVGHHPHGQGVWAICTDHDPTVDRVRTEHVVRIRMVALQDQLQLALDTDSRDLAHGSTRMTCACLVPGSSRT